MIDDDVTLWVTKTKKQKQILLERIAMLGGTKVEKAKVENCFLS